jgi:adenylate kinase family enzyme
VRVPLLSPDDPPPGRPSRVLVNGTSGAGKSTMARRLAEALDLPYTEMDALFHGPDWVPNPDFLERVESFTSQPRWACEFQYDTARPLLADRADLMVWLDYPHHLVMWRLTRRTVGRRVRRAELWNGNAEAPLRTFLTDPEHVLRWAWATRHWAGRRVVALLESHPGLAVVHLRSPAEAERWLDGPLAAAALADGQDGRR